MQGINIVCEQYKTQRVQCRVPSKELRVEVTYTSVQGRVAAQECCLARRAYPPVHSSVVSSGNFVFRRETSYRLANRTLTHTKSNTTLCQ